MILLTILAIMALILTVFTVLAIAAGGAVAVVLFGDVIVCIFVIVWVIKKIIKRKRK